MDQAALLEPQAVTEVTSFRTGMQSLNADIETGQ
jgi:hypothetical protein